MRSWDSPRFFLVSRLGASSPKRLRAEHRNEVWSWDLLYDQTEQSRTLRILTLIDEYTKECFAIHVGYSIGPLMRSRCWKQRSTVMARPNTCAAIMDQSLLPKPFRTGSRVNRSEALISNPEHPGNKPVLKASTTSCAMNA